MRTLKMMSRTEEADYPLRVTSVSFAKGDRIEVGALLYEMALADGRVVPVKSCLAGIVEGAPLGVDHVLDAPSVILEVREDGSEPEAEAAIVEEVVGEDPASEAEEAEPAETEPTDAAQQETGEPSEGTSDIGDASQPDETTNDAPKPRRWGRFLAILIGALIVLGSGAAFVMIPNARAIIADALPFGNKIPSTARLSLSLEEYGAIETLTAHGGTAYAVAYGAFAAEGKKTAEKRPYLVAMTRLSDGRYDWPRWRD